MSALEQPSEVVLLAVFAAADRAGAAARAFLHSGLDAEHVAILAPQSQGAALEAVPRSASLQMDGVGRAVARGALAVELSLDGEARGVTERLVAALRRLGLGVTDASCLVRAVRADLILLLAAVPREEAVGWGRLLQAAGAVALTARPRLRRWPPPASAGVGHRRGTASADPVRRSQRLRRARDAGPWWDATLS